MITPKILKFVWEMLVAVASGTLIAFYLMERREQMALGILCLWAIQFLLLADSNDIS